MKKFLCLLLALVMIMAMFAGCSNETTDDQGSESKEQSSKDEKPAEDSKDEEPADDGEDSLINTSSMLPVTNEPVEMDILVRLTTDSAEPEEIWFWQYYERKTNVDWQFTTVLDSAFAERKPVMMATGDYPGVILVSDAFSTNEIYSYGMEGTFLPLNDYIDQYADNLKIRFDEFPEAKSDMTCPDGNIYALAKIAPTYLGSGQANLNHVWLEQTGLDMPTTLDEFYEVLKAFKDLGDVNADGIDNEVPWGGMWESGGNRAVILNALGLVTNGSLTPGAALKGDEAFYFPLQDEFKDYLTYANKLYTEGLIDPDVFTLTDEEVVAKGQLGTIGFMALTPRYYTAEGGWEDYTYIIPMTDEAGETPVWYKSTYVNSPTFFVTDNCEYPEVAVRWIDIFYTAEHSLMAGYGPNWSDADQMEGWEGSYIGWSAIEKPNDENVLWTTGNPGGDTYQTLSFTDTEGNQLRPADMSSVQLRNMYMLPWASAAIFMMGDEWFYTQCGLAITAYENSINGTTEWQWRSTFYQNASQYQVIGYPSMYFYTEEQTNWISENLTMLNDHVSAEEAKFITGARPLDEFDAFIEEIKALGAEEYNTILHDYYENYKG